MPDNQFSRRSRLLKPAEFKQVFDHTELRGSTPHLLVLATHNELGHPRLGFVLAKKQIKHAVARNRVRRLVRESFRLHQHDLPAVDLVVLGRGSLVALDNQQIREMIDALWFRLKRPTHGKRAPGQRKSRPKSGR
ncbi:ribonuclease P protein component [Bacterioplanes sanyensis]|uniref:Ribonuclease P protein component n=1 Tax=Bacterioplanes sanyensis TaxID=1249553 RepID=A0A222FHL0_9GAMM|nr:ribonuclease P protein component [Bacterioplanes sanyensis]ASP37964.1 ribonuclease P protein component [Bacterioplanes sanyensis]